MVLRELTGSSGSTHRVLMSYCSCFVSVLHRSEFERACSQMLTHRRARHANLDPEGTREGSPANCQLEATCRRVDISATACCGTLEIGHESHLTLRARSDNDPQQLALGGPLATTDARPDRAHGGRVVRRERASEFVNHRPRL